VDFYLFGDTAGVPMKVKTKVVHAFVVASILLASCMYLYVAVGLLTSKGH